jgi:hypothetical protein
MSKSVARFLAVLALFTGGISAQSKALQIDYGAQGIQKLSYAGQTLEDLNRWPQDAFHVWHMEAYDLAGHPLTSGQFGWGEDHLSRAFDLPTKTWHYVFSWGSIVVAYQQSGDSLKVTITTTNAPRSGIVFDGATLYPLALHLSRVPSGFGEPGTSRMIDDIEEPPIVVADDEVSEITAFATDSAKPIYLGFQAVGKSLTYAAMVSSTEPDQYSQTKQPGRRLNPGQTDSFAVTLRFSHPNLPAQRVAPEAFKAFAEHYPETLHWSDRRIIGTVFLASSPQGTRSKPAGFPTNPRRYFTDAAVDISNPSGLKQFQLRVLQQAADVVANLKRLNAQGAITWDIEGEQYPQDTSYSCSPDQIAQLAPEMESIISDPTSPYAGLKLDDGYFKTIHDAGFRVGVCVRPQRLVITSDANAHQVTLPDSQVADNLIRKMKYAHDRWGATIFYLDSTVQADGKPLPSAILERAAAALPDSLLIPEESTPRMYRATAPFQTFLFHGDLGTEPAIRASYPLAFSANLVNDVDPAKLAERQSALTKSVGQGDILMLLCGYWQTNNATAVSIYRAAPEAASGR